jgi:hypothetical protein
MIDPFDEHGNVKDIDESALDAVSPEERQRIGRVIDTARVDREATQYVEQVEQSLREAIRAQGQREAELRAFPAASTARSEWEAARGPAA